MRRELPQLVKEFVAGDNSPACIEAAREHLRAVLEKRARAGHASAGKAGPKIKLDTPEAEKNRGYVRRYRRRKKQEGSE